MASSTKIHGDQYAESTTSTGSSISLFDVFSQPQPLHSNTVPSVGSANFDDDNPPSMDHDNSKVPDLLYIEWYQKAKAKQPASNIPTEADDVADFTSFYTAIELSQDISLDLSDSRLTEIDAKPRESQHEISNILSKCGSKSTQAANNLSNVSKPEVRGSQLNAKLFSVAAKQRSVKLDRKSISYHEPEAEPQPPFNKPKPLMADAITSPIKHISLPDLATSRPCNITLSPCKDVELIMKPPRLADYNPASLKDMLNINPGAKVTPIISASKILSSSDNADGIRSVKPKDGRILGSLDDAKVTMIDSVNPAGRKISSSSGDAWFDWSDDSVSSFKTANSQVAASEETNIAYKPAAGNT